MSREMEVHIKDGKVKVFEGPTRRVLHTTEEALGLMLLKLNPNNQANVELRWVDMLGTRGLAVAPAGARLVCLQSFPSHTRTIRFGRGDISNREYTVTIPDVLMASSFKDNNLQKATLWTVREGFLSKLSATSSDPTLAPWPYGNVYTHGGICWGTTPIRDIHSPQDAFDAFFNSGFNGDLFAYNSAGLLNFLDEAKKAGGVFPKQGADRHTQTVSSVAQAIVRV